MILFVSSKLCEIVFLDERSRNFASFGLRLMRTLARRTRGRSRRISEGERVTPRRRTRHNTEPASRPEESDNESDNDEHNFDLAVAAQHSYLGISGEEPL